MRVLRVLPVVNTAHNLLREERTGSSTLVSVWVGRPPTGTTRASRVNRDSGDMRVGRMDGLGTDRFPVSHVNRLSAVECIRIVSLIYALPLLCRGNFNPALKVKRKITKH